MTYERWLAWEFFKLLEVANEVVRVEGHIKSDGRPRAKVYKLVEVRKRLGRKGICKMGERERDEKKRFK